MTNYFNSYKTAPVEAFLPRINKADSPSITERLLVSLMTVSVWRERARQRRALKSLSDELLRDIGITRQQALLEAKKPFWLA